MDKVGNECGTTHYAGCACHEARRDAEVKRLKEAVRVLDLNLGRVILHWQEERAAQGHREAETVETAKEARAQAAEILGEGESEVRIGSTICEHGSPTGTSCYWCEGCVRK